ncbi:E3 ubiquitin/ISG15 ligase TRIM25-like [Engraulis encrasicolus]|uniref:E3 ubiquitin/ISG15 ligase TRIM25-like n=1 Tax=Engraulis encrasicolus TaxID=184585 RepID=UPI002FD58BAD
MATSVSVSQDEFNCCICLDLLKDPVTVPCGHSFCMSCITGFWNQEDQRGVAYSCPQCRETFTPRPALARNTLIADVVEKLKKTDLQSDAETSRLSGQGEVECDICTGNKCKVNAVKSCLTCPGSYCETHIQPHYDVPGLSKHKLVNATTRLQEKICSQHDEILKVFCRTDQKLICVLCLMDDHTGHTIVSAKAEWRDRQDKMKSAIGVNRALLEEKEGRLQELERTLKTIKESADSAVDSTERSLGELTAAFTGRIRAQEKEDVRCGQELREQLEEEVAKLKRRDKELDEGLNTHDYILSLQMLFNQSDSQSRT